MRRNRTNRITSYEIAEYMIRTKESLSAKELAVILAREYPHLDVDTRDVYLRLRSISCSRHSSVTVDDSCRPRRFRIHYLNPEFFRRSRAPRRFGEEITGELRMTYDEKEQREHQPWVMARQLFNSIARQHRQNRQNQLSYSH
ncbi:Late promoter-activating protein [Salmonella enterica]|nr:Late promoter-activating protein [Salmonella enterica]EHK5999358.1 Late promoter-activating protein [Salmonella enterica]EIF5124577.1 Late promoter-activating protein [Salmonella enterica]EIF5348753.1 Late promoter-activating protein [Salmonella enterica]EIF5657350.1 Late promoter-activating protein [Salmonella enterica]